MEKLESWLARPSGEALRLMLAPDAEQSLGDLPSTKNVELLIGAEGGFDLQEIALPRVRSVFIWYAWVREPCAPNGSGPCRTGGDAGPVGDFRGG